MIKMDEWISVFNKLPDDRRDVLIYYNKNGGEYGIGWYSCENHDPYWVMGGSMIPYNVTHWMPLPKPPEADYDGYADFMLNARKAEMDKKL